MFGTSLFLWSWCSSLISFPPSLLPSFLQVADIILEDFRNKVAVVGPSLRPSFAPSRPSSFSSVVGCHSQGGPRLTYRASEAGEGGREGGGWVDEEEDDDDDEEEEEENGYEEEKEDGQIADERRMVFSVWGAGRGRRGEGGGGGGRRVGYGGREGSRRVVVMEGGG